MWTLHDLDLDPALNDADHVKAVGEDTWHRVGDLRRTLRTNSQHSEDTTMNDVPDGYAAHIDAFRSPEQRLAAEQKAAAFNAIDRAASDIATDVSASLRALRAANSLDAYTPPDPYAEALKARR